MSDQDPKGKGEVTEKIPHIVVETPEEKETIDTKQFVSEITDRLCNPETAIKFATGDDLQKFLKILRDSPELLKGQFDDPEIAQEALKLLEKRLNDNDFVTGLERRDKQTDRVREAITSIAKSKGDFKEKAKRLGFISFDVRGLKMVNDLMKDHEYGDQYLRNIKDLVINKVIHVIEQITGEESCNLARDGGDEFSILIENSTQDLATELNAKELTEMFPRSPELVTKLLEASGNEAKSLMQRINDLVNFSMAQEVNTLIPREKLEEFMGENMPEDFELKYFVASGAATLSEIVEDPKNEYFKKDLAKKAEGKGPETGKAIVDTLLSGLRTKADAQSYEVKGAQNRQWINSGEDHDQAMIRVISRNDVTISLAERAQSEHLRANKLEGQLGQTQMDLHTCLTDKARLETHKS